MRQGLFIVLATTRIQRRDKSVSKILFLDIETTDLDADFGNMLAFGYKWQGGKTEVLSILDTNKLCKACGLVEAVDDKSLVIAARDIIEDADMLVTWFGKGFDWKFLNTRIVDAKLKPLPPTPHVDLYFTAKHHLKLTSNRLASVQDFLRLPSEKTTLRKRVWRRAQAGHVASIKYIVEHCKKDVDVLQEAYDRLKPYVRQHPTVALLTSRTCKVDGAQMQSRGTTWAGGKMLRRLACRKCGAWGKTTL
jgi:uncharacterized protein YprB with RNaseH-like and TPR domain